MKKLQMMTKLKSLLILVFWLMDHVTIFLWSLFFYYVTFNGSRIINCTKKSSAVLSVLYSNILFSALRNYIMHIYLLCNYMIGYFMQIIFIMNAWIFFHIKKYYITKIALVYTGKNERVTPIKNIYLMY